MPKLPGYEGNYEAEDLEEWVLKSNDEHGACNYASHRISFAVVLHS